MAEVTLNIHGRDYAMECDDGQEERVIALGDYVDGKMRQISDAGAASGEAHLFILTSLMMADEVFNLKNEVAAAGGDPDAAANAEEEELVIAQAIDRMAERIDSIAQRVQNV